MKMQRLIRFFQNVMYLWARHTSTARLSQFSAGCLTARRRTIAVSSIIDTVNFTSIRADNETKAAIQKKISAQQDLETAQVQAKTAEVEAEKDKKVAQVNAKTKKIKAQAEADANAIINNSLTDNVLRQEMLDKWDGKLPTYDGTGATSVILGK